MLKQSALVALVCLLTLPLHAAKTPPQPLEGLQPVYPPELKQKGEMGEAKVLVEIDATGAVTGASLKSATHEAFGAAALEAVRTWRFKPAEEDGQPIATAVTIPLQFKLSLKEQINAQAGREVFVDIDQLTDKVHGYNDVKKWFGLKGKNANRVPYPEALKGSGISEEVTVQLIISPEGLPLNPAIVNIQNKQLALPVIQHVAKARFQPPKLDDKPIYLQQKVKLIVSEDPEFGKKPAKGK